MAVSYFVIQCILVCYLVQLCLSGEHEEWSYEGSTGPENWPNLFPKFCGGMKQSPLDISDPKDSKNLTSLSFTNYDQILKDSTFINNGHTVQLSNKNSKAKISGGCLTSTYSFVQLHFHWGSADDKGSEHTLNGKPFSMEAHIVHMNDKYSTLDQALKQPDGLAVLGIWYQVKKDANNADSLAPLIEAIGEVQTAEKQTTVQNFKLSSFLPKDTTKFYCYKDGSLTTPKCNEAVIWTVFNQVVDVSTDDIKKYRSLKNKKGKKLVDNFRPVQKLNDRTIFSFKKSE